MVFTYYRQPRISSYTPHGGPVACTQSAVEGTTGLPVGDMWDNTQNSDPTPACNLQRNWQPVPQPQVVKMVAAGINDGYGSGDTISLIFDQPSAAGMDYVPPPPPAPGSSDADDPSASVLRLRSGDRAYVDQLFSFLGNGAFDWYTLGYRAVPIPGFSEGEAVSLGNDYSGG